MAKKLSLKKAPLRITPKSKRPRRPRAAAPLPAPECGTCTSWYVLMMMLIALGLNISYGRTHAKQQYRLGVAHGACSWELYNHDNYPGHTVYRCNIGVTQDLDVHSVEVIPIK